MQQSIGVNGLKSSFFLVLAMLLGIIVGIFCKNLVFLNIIAKIFLNLLLTVLVPFVFFSIVTAIINIPDLQKARKLSHSIILVFVATGFVVAILSGIIVYHVFAGANLHLPILAKTSIPIMSVDQAIVGMFTVDKFYQLASPQHLLSSVIFAMLTGFSVKHVGVQAQPIVQIIIILESVLMRMFSLVMQLAPIGFFAFFYMTIQQCGQEMLHQCIQIISAYYGWGLLYGTLGFSLWLLLIKGRHYILPFWRTMLPTAIMALASCSSVACIPANIAGVRQMGVQALVADTVIPIGSLLHKTGSIMGGMFKIGVVLYLLLNINLTLSEASLAVLLSLLVGTVMGAIPSGGMLGELLILSVYGLPSSMLMYLVAISVLIDPLATYLNVLGNAINAVLADQLYRRALN